jgi:hypothetical protein
MISCSDCGHRINMPVSAITAEAIGSLPQGLTYALLPRYAEGSKDASLDADIVAAPDRLTVQWEIKPLLHASRFCFYHMARVFYFTWRRAMGPCLGLQSAQRVWPGLGLVLQARRRFWRGWQTGRLVRPQRSCRASPQDRLPSVDDRAAAIRLE